MMLENIPQLKTILRWDHKTKSVCMTWEEWVSWDKVIRGLKRTWDRAVECGVPTPLLPAPLLGSYPSSNSDFIVISTTHFSLHKLCDCFFHICYAIALINSVHGHIITWESTQNHFCSTSHYDRCLQDHILPWSHKRRLTRWKQYKPNAVMASKNAKNIKPTL